MSYSKKITNLFIICNIFTVFIYLLTCLVPFLNAGKFWFIALLGLIFPWLFFVVLFFFISGLIIRSRWSLLSLLAILLSWQQLAVVFAFHTGQPFTLTKVAENLRILSWNVSSWDEYHKVSSGGTSYRQVMLEEVKNSRADILCFQEFLETKDTAYFDPNIPEIKKMGYPYHHYVPSYSYLENTETGMVIFSKYPITNTGIFDFGGKGYVQQLIYADIQCNQKKIRVFTIHLQPANVSLNEYQSLYEIKHIESVGLKDSKTIVSKLKGAYHFRSQQADTVNSYVRESPYPVILCGDFNDVPNSYTYFTIKGNMQDAFLQKGSGIGRTSRHFSPTLRIDYIFADEKFSIKQYDRITVPYSDHYGIMADIAL